MKNLATFLLLSLAGKLAYSQNGLEGIIVEKYYITEANDTNANSIGGNLPINSTTYRIYVDMLPNYKFQAAFGLTNHELRLETSTLFFNNSDYGSTSPTFSKNNARKNTVMLDSWVSTGAACTGNYGILKTEDNGVSNAVNNFSPLILQGNNSLAGLPLTQQDGFMVGTPCQVTAVGITSELSVFDNQTIGNLFSTFNGSWACLTGATGPDTVQNKVLIAQITTDGNFKFKLNLQLGTPTGGVEQYVAENATGSQIQFADLIFDSSLWTTLLNNTTHSVTALKTYPTVVEEILNVELSNNKNDLSGNYIIHSVDGHVALTGNYQTLGGMFSNKINACQLSSGMYFITFYTKEGASLSRKFIKK